MSFTSISLPIAGIFRTLRQQVQLIVQSAKPEVLRIRDCLNQVLLVLKSKDINWYFLYSLLDPVSHNSAFLHKSDANYADSVYEYFSHVL